MGWRLIYLGNVVGKAPPTLCALLGCNGTTVLPWVSLVKADLSALYFAWPARFDDLGPPCDNFARWATFIHDFPTEWKKMVKQYCTFDSAADVGSRKRPRPIEGDTVFRCSRCVTDNEFVSRKALLAHATEITGTELKCGGMLVRTLGALCAVTSSPPGSRP